MDHAVTPASQAASPPRSGLWREIAACVLAAGLPVLLLVWLLDLRHADLSIPLKYGGGDAMSMQLWAKGLHDNPWMWHNAYLGAPAGQDLRDYPTSDSLQYGLLKLLIWLTDNPFQGLNLYFLLGFPLTVLTTLFVLRQLGIGRGPAVVAGVLYAFLPYHLLCGVGHVFLGAYYHLPLMVWVLLQVFLDQGLFWACDESSGRVVTTWTRGRTWAAVLVCLIVASAGVYYAFFGCFFLLVAGLSAAFARRHWYPAAAAGLLVAITTLGVAGNIVPHVLARVEQGPNPDAVVRTRLNSEAAGLKITQLLMPIENHRLAPLARVRARYQEQVRKLGLPDRSGRASLGIVGSVGFLFLVVSFLVGRSSERPSLLRGLGALTVSGLLLGTVAGFGVVVALAGASWIRGYNRISVYIACFAFFAVAVALDWLVRRYAVGRWSRLACTAGLGALLLGGILDQTTSGYFPPYEETAREFRSDAALVARIESMLPAESMIFQLPYLPYPEPYPLPHQLSSYDQARGYLQSRTLRWSYGCIKGRETAAWYSETAALPPADLVARVIAAGFQGIWIDRRGYADGGAALEQELRRLLGCAPLESDNKRLAFYPLGQQAEVARVLPALGR